MKTHAFVIATVISVLTFFSKPADAATLLVTNTADSGPGSLRVQIAAANPGDIVYCTNLTAQTLTLTSGQIVISNSSLTINGAGLSISGNNASRIFLVTSNSVVTLISNNLVNGSVTSDSGGAIRNDGTLTLTNCVFNQDSAIGGAGFSVAGTQNGGAGGGGAGMGGAIFSDGPSLTMFGCGFHQDTAQGGNGGAGNTEGYSSGAGGYGGGPNGTVFNVTPTPLNGGFGGGGSGGWGVPGTGFVGGNGGFGGGGGGGGGAYPSPTGGNGGAGGSYGGAGGAGSSYSAGGGGGAGLGGAVFALGGTVNVVLCDFEQNLATNGIGGANAANGQGVGASLFLDGAAANNVVSNTFVGNVASSTAAGDVVVSVMNTNDSGPGSLRGIIAGLPSGATITFDPSLAGKTIHVGALTGPILVANNVIIDASALPGGIAISGNGSFRLFQIAPNVTVTLNSLALSGGRAYAGSGGAIYSDGTLVALNCGFSNNAASGTIGYTSDPGNAGGGGGGAGLGGAIFSDGPAVVLGGCTFNNNSVQGANGGTSYYSSSLGGVPGNGGAPNGGVGGSANATGIGGGGSGGYGGAGVYHGGNGGFGGGGGGGGGDFNNTQAGAGGLGGSFGGNGGNAAAFYVPGGGGGGGGAGLGGAVFSLNGLTVITNCSFTGNAATSGQGGTGGGWGDDGAPGQAMGAAVFADGQSSFLAGNLFQNNVAASGPSATLAVAVGNYADAGPGSLRSLMTNVVDGLTTIIFAPGMAGQTILVTNGQFVITNNLVIDASGLSSAPTLSGGLGSSRLFLISAGVALTLNNLTLLSGRISGDSGGAIRNDGSLTALNCTFQGNTASGGNGLNPDIGGGGAGGGAGMGGAIFSDGPTLTLNGCNFVKNHASGGNGSSGNSSLNSSTNPGGAGGDPNGGSAGTPHYDANLGIIGPGGNGGFGGGGGGAASGTGAPNDGHTFQGGAGGFGGGGGAAGGSYYNSGSGGAGGSFGGAGGGIDSNNAGGGGGGAGLGGAVFTLNSAVTISGCLFTNNIATNGVGGNPNGGNGQAWGGALFMIGGNLALANNTFQNNSASTAAPDQFTESDVLSFTTVAQKLQVSWPTNAIGFHVQYATNLTPPIVWQALSGSISNNGISFQQSLSTITNNPAFFRLSPVSP